MSMIIFKIISKTILSQHILKSCTILVPPCLIYQMHLSCLAKHLKKVIVFYCLTCVTACGVYIDATYPYILCFVANKHDLM